MKSGVEKSYKQLRARDHFSLTFRDFTCTIELGTEIEREDNGGVEREGGEKIPGYDWNGVRTEQA